MSTQGKGYTLEYIAFENNKLPDYKEVKGKDYIYYGGDNLYPNYLLELRYRCSKHNAIIQSKSRFISGGGLVTDNKEAQVFLQNRFSVDNGDEVFAKLTSDYETFGGYAVGVTWSNDKKTIASFCHIEFAKLRESVCGGHLLYCEDWSDNKIIRNKENLKPYCKFNKNNREGFQIIYEKGYTPYYKPLVYPLPSYLGAIPSIEADVEIANFHLNNIKNGFSGSTIVTLRNGEPPAEKKREIERQFKKKHTGTDRAGGVMIMYANRDADAPTVQNITASDLDKQFLQLRENTTQEIMVGHEITSPMLFGIKEAGQLGGRNELDLAFELFNNSYVKYRQKIFEKLFNDMAMVNGIKNPDIKAKTVKPLGLDVTNPQIQAVLTRDEVREVLGYKPLGVVAQPTQMSSDDCTRSIIELFSQVGEKEENFSLISRRGLFADMTPNEKKVLGILKDNSNADAPTIAKALKIGIQDAQDILDKLVSDGLVEVSKDGVKTITDAGTTAIDENKVRTIQVRYKYEAKNGEDIIPTSRKFCRFIVGEKKLYTRDEIDSISDKVGFSVWNYRGGWYHNPNTDKNQPYCRHIWKQVSVIKK